MTEPVEPDDAPMKPEPAPVEPEPAPLQPTPETVPILPVEPAWQAVHERFQRGLLHRRAKYVWAHPNAPSWRVSSVGILRPAGQQPERLWMIIPLAHLLAPDRLREGILMKNTVVALPAAELPPAEIVAEIEGKAGLPVVVFSSQGVVGGPLGEAPDIAGELRATLAYDDATLARVDPDKAYAVLSQLDKEREFHRNLNEAMPRVWVTNGMAAALVGVWLLQVALGLPTESPSGLSLLDWGACQPALIAAEPWRLVSAGFLHSGLLHLGFNTVGIVWFGRIAERLFGHVAFAAIFLLSIFGGFLLSCAWSPETVAAVGASGGLFGILGAIAGFALRRRGDIPRGVFRRLGGIVALLILANMGLTLWLSVALPIDNAGHIGGLLIGLVAGLLLARPLPANRPPSKGQLLTTGLIVLALLCGYVATVQSPGVTYQRLLWEEGVSPFVHRFKVALQPLFTLKENVTDSDRPVLAKLQQDFESIRKDAEGVQVEGPSKRALDAVVGACLALEEYIGAYKFKEGRSEPIAVPTPEQERALEKAFQEFMAAQRHE